MKSLELVEAGTLSTATGTVASDVASTGTLAVEVVGEAGTTASPSEDWGCGTATDCSIVG